MYDSVSSHLCRFMQNWWDRIIHELYCTYQSQFLFRFLVFERWRQHCNFRSGYTRSRYTPFHCSISPFEYIYLSIQSLSMTDSEDWIRLANLFSNLTFFYLINSVCYQFVNRLMIKVFDFCIYDKNFNNFYSKWQGQFVVRLP